MTTTEHERGIVPAEPTAVAQTLAAVVDRAWWDDAVMLGGWAIGVRVFEEKLPPCALVTHLAELEDRGLELALARAADRAQPAGSAVLEIVRQVRAASTLLETAAVQAFSQAALAALQAKAREARHALRNPIGTIRNALSMLREATEPSAPGGERSSGAERLHEIALRGTGALETLVRERLAGVGPAEVFLGTGLAASEMLASLVQALTPRAQLVGVELTAREPGPAGSKAIRALGVDLVLRSVAIAGLRAASPGSLVQVEPVEDEAGRGWIRVHPQLVARHSPELLADALELAGLAGLTVSGALDAEGVCVQAWDGLVDSSGRK